MTELIITPNYDKKTARFKGTIAGGESVKVTIVGAAKWLSSGLRLRVVCGCSLTVAMFPLKSEDGTVSSFEVEGDDLIAAPLELNTIQARLYTQGFAATAATFIVEDLEKNILYFQDSYELHGWVKRDGDEEPYDLTKFPELIEDWRKQIENLIVDSKEVDGGIEVTICNGVSPAKTFIIRNGRNGQPGEPGRKGEDGKSLKFSDLTEAQKAELKGPKGDTGEGITDELRALPNKVTENAQAIEANRVAINTEENRAKGAEKELSARIEESKANAAAAMTAASKAQDTADRTVTEIATLVGDDAGDKRKSARQIAAEEVAKVIAGADTNYDTLKEIADYIKNDATDAAQLKNKVTNLEATKADKSDVVAPSPEGEGKAADAKATHEALHELEEKIKSIGGGISQMMTEITHAELKSLRDNGELIPGMRYRITDFIPYENERLNFEEKVSYRVESSGRRYDIIITAITNNSLNDYVKAAVHEGTTYYTDGLLSQWQLWYSIDITSYDGVAKGCIYRMVDERGNDLPYDFKNIYFRPSGQADSEPTFASGSDVSDFVVKHNERFPNYRLIKVLADSYIRNVVVGGDSHLITFSGVVANCVIGEECSEVNIASSQNITIGRGAEEITITDCRNITIGNDAYYFGIGQCGDVSIESSCSNMFLSSTKRSTVGFGCDTIYLRNGRQVTIGNNCQYISFGTSSIATDLYPIWNAIIEDNVAQLTFSGKPASASALMNFTIKSGVGGKDIVASATNKLYSNEYTTVRPTGSYTLSV